MLKHLRKIGYKNLKVVKRPSSHHRNERIKQIKA